MMKSIIYILLPLLAYSCKSRTELAGLTKEERTSQNSLSWTGIYNGIVPCLQCEGVLTTVIIKDDLTYMMQSSHSYNHQIPVTETGKYSWNKKNNTITLIDYTTTASHDFFIMENAVRSLDDDSMRAVLHKEMYNIKENYWKLTELNNRPISVNDSFIKEPYIIFKAHKNEIIGFGSCNSIKCYYEINEVNKIHISEISSTRVSCGAMPVENEFINVLKQTSVYLTERDQLILLDKGHKTLAKFSVVYLR